ncbi:MAG: hypothetical protein JRJ58_15750 [Deltaproteobacteria bacterium]|nr:hypothetical protein [Deltaproteobacteria bacterium]
MSEERAIADRLSGYADAIAAFSLVNALGFLAAVAELETRCSLAGNRVMVIVVLVALQILYGAAVVGLRRLEIGMREGLESSTRAIRFRRGFYQGRLIFITIVTLAMTITSWFTLNPSSCATG